MEAEIKGRPRKASIVVAADLRRQIVTGELQANEPLPIEDDLMQELAVSRGVVREALRILETEGLVSVRRGAGGGPTVRHPTIQQMATGVGTYLQLGDVLVTDVWEARDRMIGNAVERLARDHTEQDASALASVVFELSNLVGDLPAYYPQLIAVGETVVRLAGNSTEHILVMALRHVIAEELEQATRDVLGNRASIDVEQAVTREREIADAWEAVALQVRAGRPRAARLAYERATLPILEGTAKRTPDKVVDMFQRGVDGPLTT